MNISTLSRPEIRVAQLTLLIRDLDALRAVCRRRGWEFRTGQLTYRWFGRWLDDPPSLALLGRCAHALGIPGCLYEVGLVARRDHFVPVWDDGAEGGLDAALGPGGRLLWQSYVVEKLRREAHRRRHSVGALLDRQQPLRVRVVENATGRSAHVRLAADGATLWTFGTDAWETFFYLAEALGRAGVPSDGECP